MKTLAEQNKAMKILHDRFLPFLVSEVMKSAQIHEPPHVIERERAPKVYRVSVEEISKVRETK